ncbi:transporter substrate-binding domain-containing protein [Thaumasiovibrio subtropicus]|uniref:transporter substrate-binding domain-containing protein n=1 Tax=Thaumasiovibrio subtropicus TaxID=1891207 RepID=UPI00192D01AD|nr:transporter substrate-binding domain-containing protein [Thaumasiovibrio subtropicus]
MNHSSYFVQAWHKVSLFMSSLKRARPAHFYTRLLLSLNALTSLSALAHPTIIVGGDHNYPPYEFINAQGEPDGYNVDLTRAVAEVMGMHVTIQLESWDAARAKLLHNEIDVLQGMSYSRDRALDFDFSPAHAIIHQSIFARKGTESVENLSELTGKDVIVQSDGIMHDLIRQQNLHANLILVDTHANALRLLASGKHDFALVANLPGLYLGKELDLTNIIPVGKPFGAQRYGFAVKKGNDALLAQFSEGLAIVINTGRQQAIYDKWFSQLEDPRHLSKDTLFAFLAAAVLLLAVLGMIVVWNRTLQQQVAARTQEIEAQQQQLIQADKLSSLGILVSGVAHEINNPTSLLMLNLPLFKDIYGDISPILEQHYQTHGDFRMGGLSYSRMREDAPLLIDDMLAGTQRIRRIVEDLRDFARKDSSAMDEEVDINEVVQAAIRILDNTIKKSTQHFIVDDGQSLPLIQGNAQRIEQVIINLLLNACQALTSTEQCVWLSTQFSFEQQAILVQIRDEGVGIDKENLTRLTDPFFTTKRESGGTGLGLSVSMNIIEQHQGTLTFHSHPGEGTTATIRLPLNLAVPPAVSALGSHT